LVVLQLPMVGWIFMMTNEYGMEQKLKDSSRAIQLSICLLRLVKVVLIYSHV